MKHLPAKHSPRADVLNWVAELARLCPGLTFAPGTQHRDAKTRIVVMTLTADRYECVVQEDTPQSVAAALNRQAATPPRSCGCSAAAHPEAHNSMAGEAERDGRVCELGWPKR